MEQIHDRDYAGRYGMDSRQVFLIGANFNEKKDNRGLEYEIEELKHGRAAHMEGRFLNRPTRG